MAINKVATSIPFALCLIGAVVVAVVLLHSSKDHSHSHSAVLSALASGSHHHKSEVVTPPVRPIVHIPTLGGVQGRAGLRRDTHNAVDVFLGIPYAKPPVGRLRWKAPQSHGEWSTNSPLDASHFGARCIQNHVGIGADTFATPLSEDCL